MPEAWNITTSDSRSLDGLMTYYIFCEDQNDEPYYFNSFQIEDKLKINCIPNQKKSKLNLINTLATCRELGIIDFTENSGYKPNNPAVNIWSVYDRDLESTDFSVIKPGDNMNFTVSVGQGLHAGIKVAWSNDAFELWILLHFEEVPTDSKLHRNYIYDRLTEILKVMPEISKQYNASILAATFGYKTHLKRRVAFITYVLPLLAGNIHTAIGRAEKLEAIFANNVETHDRNPCTMVHYLTKELLSYR